MIGDNCLAHSPQLLQCNMYVLFLLASPKLNLLNSICFAVGCLLSGQVIDFHGGRAPLAYAFQRVSLHPHTCSTCKTGRTGFTTLYITSAYELFLLHFGKFWSIQAGRLTTFSLNFKRRLANLEIISNSAKLNQKSGGLEIIDLHFG